MSYPLTPDSPSYQEIALQVAIRDLLNGFKNLKPTNFRSTLSKLAPYVETLRNAREDLTFAPFELRLAVNSFVSAFEFAASTPPSVFLDDYLQGAFKRLNAVVAAPDQALVASQEATLRATLTDFIAAQKALQDIAAPARKTNPKDFPNLPPLPKGRLQSSWQQSKQTRLAASRLKAADRALHRAYSDLTFAPVHLRLALSHFLMTLDALSDIGGVSTQLLHARQRLQKAFDPATLPAPSVYQAAPPSSAETQEIDLRRAAVFYLESEDAINKVHRTAPSRSDIKNQEVLNQYRSAIHSARAQSASALRHLIQAERFSPQAPPEVRFAITDFLMAYNLLSDISTDTARMRIAAARNHLKSVLATPTPSRSVPVHAGAYYQALTDKLLDSLPDDEPSASMLS